MPKVHRRQVCRYGREVLGLAELFLDPPCAAVNGFGEVEVGDVSQTILDVGGFRYRDETFLGVIDRVIVNDGCHEPAPGVFRECSGSMSVHIGSERSQELDECCFLCQVLCTFS